MAIATDYHLRKLKADHTHLSPIQVDALLDELCVVLGFCLPPKEQARLRESAPTDVDAFTDTVIRAEGLDPYADIPLNLRRDVRARIAEHFRKAEDERVRSRFDS